MTLMTQMKTGSVYYNQDVLDLQLASLASLQNITYAEITVFSFTRSQPTVSSHTQITASLTLPVRIYDNSFIRVSIPLDQFDPSLQSYQFKQNTSSAAQALNFIQQNGSHVTLEMQEFCVLGAAKICGDNT